MQVDGDPDLVERLIENLLENAVRHNLVGGLVHVESRLDPTEAVIVVTNTGRVIDEADIEGLFEPFRKGSSTRHPGGVGLGLSIAVAIAVAHRATLRAAPNPGGGLRVELRIPARVHGPVDRARGAG